MNRDIEVATKITILPLRSIFFPVVDFIHIFNERWMFIIPIVAILIIYLITVDIRRFLAVIGLLLAFQLMWESLHVASGHKFPFFSLQYTVPLDEDVFIMTIPTGAVLLKGLVPLVGSYFFTSMATRKLTESKIDIVKDRGKNVMSHVGARFLASAVFTVSMMIIEPVLVAGDRWALGPFETFDDPVYFGVTPLYFAGVFVTSTVSYICVGIIESRIGYDKEKVLYDFEGTRQSPVKYQMAGFFVMTTSVLVFSFIALFIDIQLGLIDLLIGVPVTFMLFLILSKYSDSRERINVDNFCNDNPASFLCDL